MPMPFITKMLDITKDVKNWEDLGYALNISRNNLEIILLRNPQDEGKAKAEMFAIWIKNDENASWEKFRAALKRIKRRDLAKVVQKEYCKTHTHFIIVCRISL